MARARNIKPSFFSNEDLVELSFECRLLFIGLWVLADREGRVEYRPKRIKMEIFPADSVDVATCIASLSGSGFVRVYEANGVKVVQIENFIKHQSPHGLEKDSDLPDENGFYTIHERAKNKTITGVSKLVNSLGTDIEQLKNSFQTFSQQDRNALNPDSLNPDSLKPETPTAPILSEIAEPEPEETSADDALPILPHVALSIAMRKHKVDCQPANPLLHELAAQGVTPETAEAACLEAIKSKPEGFSLGYVCGILKRWADDAKKMKVSGASAPKKTSAWWASDSTILAEGLKYKLQPYAGETMPSFKARIEAAIEKASAPTEKVPTKPNPSSVAPLQQESHQQRDMSPEAVARRREALEAVRKGQTRDGYGDAAA